MSQAGSPTISKAAGRTRDIARAALAAFIQGGYRLTQIAHVADRLGVSVGSIYRYVESKEALFHLAALESLDRLPDGLPVPFKVAGSAETVTVLTEMIAEDPLWPTVRSIVGRPPTADAKAEAQAIAGELYDVISARGAFINLLDRCAQDIPELAEVFDQRIRRRLMGDIVTWVVRLGVVAGGGRAEAEALARGAMEAVSWLAKNRPGDRTAGAISDAQARAAAVRIFANAFD
ncbi:MAG TPA: helix-turn-helix domain-containing protein [Caulobacteraceae bacterium]|nr:helix-turn-helix domain-containing protein [Caulobacteraceae bacterium]